MTQKVLGKGNRRGSRGHHYHQMSREELWLAREGLVEWVPGERDRERGREGQRETGREGHRERAREGRGGL